MGILILMVISQIKDKEIEVVNQIRILIEA